MCAGRPDAPPLVLVHGIGEDAPRSWYGIVPELAKRYRVIMPHLPGFGDSPAGNDRLTPVRYARVVDEVIDRYARAPDAPGKGPGDDVAPGIVLAGHSLGGVVAIAYAAFEPEKVDRLILLDVAGVLHPVEYLPQALRGGQLLVNVTDLRNGGNPPPEELLENAELRRRLLGGRPNIIAGLAIAFFDAGPALERIDAPTLIVWGTDDDVAPTRTAHVLNARLPQSELVWIEGARHLPMRDRPEEVSERMLAWLSRTPTTARQAPPMGVDASRVGRCEADEGRLFTGPYARIELDRCGDVRIEEATVGRLIARDSVARLRNVHLGPAKRPLAITESNVEMTGGSIRGSTCIEAEGSTLNVAGAELRCEETLMEAIRRTKALFSATRYAGPEGTRPLHEFLSLEAGERR